MTDKYLRKRFSAEGHVFNENMECMKCGLIPVIIDGNQLHCWEAQYLLEQKKKEKEWKERGSGV